MSKRYTPGEYGHRQLKFKDKLIGNPPHSLSAEVEAFMMREFRFAPIYPVDEKDRSCIYGTKAGQIILMSHTAPTSAIRNVVTITSSAPKGKQCPLEDIAQFIGLKKERDAWDKKFKEIDYHPPEDKIHVDITSPATSS